MFFENANSKTQNCEDGVTRKILATGGALMLTEVCFAKGAAGAMHRHPHEQVSYIAFGAFQFTLNGVHQVIKQGDSVYSFQCRAWRAGAGGGECHHRCLHTDPGGFLEITRNSHAANPTVRGFSFKLRLQNPTN